jgi:hypothetical protein
MQRPANLQMAMSLARAYERRSAEAARAIHASPARPASHPCSQATATAPVVEKPPGGAPPPQPEKQPRPRFRCLLPNEIAEKHANG